jgi:hypothetical protein
LITAQSGKRTIISRSVLEQLLFKQPWIVASQPEKNTKQMQFDISAYYNLTELQYKYGI